MKVCEQAKKLARRPVCWMRGHRYITTIMDAELTHVSLIPKEDHPNPWVRANSPGPMAYNLGITNLKTRRECRRCGSTY